MVTAPLFFVPLDGAVGYSRWWKAFLAYSASCERVEMLAGSLPSFVCDELEAFATCGDFERGFLVLAPGLRNLLIVRVEDGQVRIELTPRTG